MRIFRLFSGVFACESVAEFVVLFLYEIYSSGILFVRCRMAPSFEQIKYNLDKVIFQLIWFSCFLMMNYFGTKSKQRSCQNCSAQRALVGFVQKVLYYCGVISCFY